MPWLRFTPGTETMANCMMNVSHRRKAGLAAQQRVNVQNQMTDYQMEMNRRQAQRVADAAAGEQREADVMRMINSSPSGIGIPFINPANCSVSIGVNAGSMTGH